MIKKLKNKLFSTLQPKAIGLSSSQKIRNYLNNGKIPWAEGYEEYKADFIQKTIASPEQLNFFKTKLLPADFAKGLDERSVEYPWIIERLSKKKSIILDAGSTFNFEFMVEHSLIKNKELTIYTFYPEKACFFKNRINYVFGDLRNLYFKDETFDEIVSQSTIEHIDMDNSIYGYNEQNTKETKSYEHQKAVLEMIRVLKPKGKLLITFPYGKYEYHGFFQQFDKEMLQGVIQLMDGKGTVEIDYFKYEKEGWRFAKQDELVNVVSYNPHTGKGKLSDGAAHCRSIACIEFIKK